MQVELLPFVIGGDNPIYSTPETLLLPMTEHLSIPKVCLRDLAGSIISIFDGIFYFDLLIVC